MKHPGDTEAKLSLRERELADFVENAIVSLHWVAADGTILWANQAELDLLGYSPEEYIGKNIAEFHLDQDVIEDILSRLTAGERLSNYDARLRCKDGSIKHVLISSSAQFEDEQFIHTRCFTIDITRRKRAEERIRLLYQLTAALSEALTPQQVARVIVEQGVAILGASAGSVVLLSKDTTTLEILVSLGYPERVTQAWQQFSLDTPVPLAESVRSQKPIWLQTREEFQSRYPSIGELPLKEYCAWATIPLIIEKRTIGSLGFSFSTPQSFDEEERNFMVALAQQCAQALERARLAEEARELAVIEERQRLARDLHDATSQSLFSINVLAQSVPRLFERNPERAQEQLQQLVTISQAAMAEMRSLLLELRPAALIKASLPDLLAQLINAAQARRPIAITAHIELEQSLPEDVHVVLYRIVQEGINNMVRHSQATEGHITLTTEADELILRIRDNGRGFDPIELPAGLGLGIIRERAAIIGATFDIESSIGSGTEIIIKWALPP